MISQDLTVPFLWRLEFQDLNHSVVKNLGGSSGMRNEKASWKKHMVMGFTKLVQKSCF